MNSSLLLKQLLDRAEVIRLECGASCLSAPCVLAAMAEKCQSPYEGITPLDAMEVENFEEERLRLLFRRVFRASGQLTAHVLKKNRAYDDTDFLQENTALLKAEMQQREKKFLTADLTFLAAIRALAPEHRPGATPEFRGDFSIAEILKETDEKIFDYVVTEIGAIQRRLQEKADRAKAIRDWRPAAKFMEPEELESAFYSSIQAETEGALLKISLPHFFGKDTALTLTLCFCDNCYFVHDNGCALSLLRQQTGTAERFDAVFDRIRKNLSAEGERVIGAFSQPWGFFHYLQTLIFVAHADLYWEQLDEQGLYCDPGIVFPQKGEPLDHQQLLSALKENLSFCYDINTGLSLAIGTRYSLNSHWIAYQIETLSDAIRIRDAYAGKLEGEILESFYWGHEDLRGYRAFIEPYLTRFGGELIEKDLCLSASKEDWLSALFRFINLAVLCSELGRLIDLPEVAQ